MGKIIIALVLLLGSFPSFAAEANGTITWQAPTAYVNGDPLDAATEIDFYTIYFGTSSRNYSLGTINVPNDNSGATAFTLPLPGPYQDGDIIVMYYAMTATVNNDPATNPAWDGAVSDYSNEVRREFLVSITPSGPMPPTGVTDQGFVIECQNQVAGVTCTITPQ